MFRRRAASICSAISMLSSMPARLGFEFSARFQ
jgi:hypothetical protein